MTLNANPVNYFAETEQVAFHPGHLVPGIDVTNDPLLQVRLFSYIDTQISRLGGPNFSQLPINRPHAPVNDMLRDGMHQTAVHGGAAPYRPNSLDGGCPFLAGADLGAFIDVPEELAAAVKERKSPASFDDHYSQARLFFRSLTPVEQDHVIQAYTFELGKCREEAVRQRQLLALANIDAALCAAVAAGLGMPAPQASEQVEDAAPSPAVSQLGGSWPVAGRVVGIIADEDSDLESVRAARTALDAAGIVPLVIAPAGGFLGGTDGGIPVQRTYLTARSTEFDAVLIAGVGRAGDRCRAGAGRQGRRAGGVAGSARRAAAFGDVPARQGNRRLGSGCHVPGRGEHPAGRRRASPWATGRTTSWRSSPGCSLRTGPGSVSRPPGPSTVTHWRPGQPAAGRPEGGRSPRAPPSFCARCVLCRTGRVPSRRPCLALALAIVGGGAGATAGGGACAAAAARLLLPPCQRPPRPQPRPAPPLSARRQPGRLRPRPAGP